MGAPTKTVEELTKDLDGLYLLYNKLNKTIMNYYESLELLEELIENMNKDVVLLIKTLDRHDIH